MTEAPRSPKSRLRPVFAVDDAPAASTESVTYQLEDTGHAVLRLRPTVRVVDEDGQRRFLYRVDAFSRLRGTKLGTAEVLAPPGSPAEFTAESRQFQDAAFQETIKQLSDLLIRKYGRAEPPAPVQR